MGKTNTKAKSNKKPVKKEGQNPKKKFFIVSAVVLALALVVTAIVIFATPKGDVTPENAQTIQAFYSTKSLEGDFVIFVQDLGGVYSELYDKNGIYVKFKSGEKIYDQEGNELSREELVPGDILEVYYDGKVAKGNPKAITAYKVVRITH